MTQELWSNRQLTVNSWAHGLNPFSWDSVEASGSAFVNHPVSGCRNLRRERLLVILQVGAPFGDEEEMRTKPLLNPIEGMGYGILCEQYHWN